MSLNPRIMTVLESRFPNNDVAPKHYGELLTQYLESRLSPPHLVSEIETKDEGKLWSNIWEAMLYRHFRSLNYSLHSRITAAGQLGPDFGLVHQGQTIWIEAIVPAPEGISVDWLEAPRSGEIRVKTKPDQERALRCTSAITDKQKKFCKYRTQGIIGPGDCAVIAVNICRLSDWDFDGNGISQLPLVMEAVFPIGHIAVPITSDGKPGGPAQNVARYELRKPNASGIQTANFLDPAFANVSAVLQAHQKDMFAKGLNIFIVHNPLASNPLPVGLFARGKEFIADRHGGKFLLKQIA
jgi:hypothetical protein